MSSTETLPMRPPRHSETEQSLAWPWRRVIPWVVLLTTLMLGMILWSLSAEQRAIARMQPQERAEVFTKTTQGFQSLCVKEPNPALEPRCRELARFLRYFPECDAMCKQQTMPFLEGLR